ncbi:hypothetical protein EYC84_011121 [Monilinia fructicola]|uniref:DUF7924 domain-containing protein n=1 Tax=Monilinia fructicola TaxID=38448 RepID=A0A5M9JC16_MONFR|nr:hypothetical protein EYC84_011121 [Monilinia fructicola]
MLLPQDQEQTGSNDRNIKSSQPFPSPTSNPPGLENEDNRVPRKRLQSSTLQPHTKDTIYDNTIANIGEKEVNPIEYWTKELHWPNEYFEPDNNMNHLLARKKSSSSLLIQQVLQIRVALWTSQIWALQMQARTSAELYWKASRSYLKNTLFRDETFDKVCRKIQDRNEARVVQDIARLIVPSAESLATCGATHLELLIESVNEGWNSAIPFYGPRPQPDYSVGFARSAFTNDQLEKLTPFVGEITDICTSYFMATWQIYLPFLTSEVKCGTAALDTADRQNAHSMTMAVKGTVELFRLVKREKELHREILAFSISHDNRTVRIYGHYPVIEGGNTTFYRHPIHTFDFTALDGKERWTAYKFTKNVYDIWMPIHLKRIRSVIDDLPSGLNFEVSQQSESGKSGISQGLESHNMFEQTSCEAVSLKEGDDQSSRIGSGHETPDTLFSQEVEERVFKKAKEEGSSINSTVRRKFGNLKGDFLS